MHISTTGLVIKTRNLDEDRVIHIFTEEYGTVTAYAGGARKNKGKLVSSTEILCYSRFVLFKNKDKYVVNSAESEKVFIKLRADIKKLALANHMCNLAGALYGEGEPCPAQLRLLLNSLYYLEKGKRENSLIKSVYELRSLGIAGFMPDLVACNTCGKYEEDVYYFSPLEGVLYCMACYCALSAAQGTRLHMCEINKAVLAAMRQILYAPPEKLFQFTMGQENNKRLETIVEHYLYNHMECALPALEYYKGIQ